MQDESKQFDLDLDALQPVGKTVRLEGNSYIVKPAKFKNLLKMSSLSARMQNGKATEDDVDDLMKCLFVVMPELENENIDLSVEQFGMLVGFIIQMAQPSDVKKLKEMGVSLKQEDGEKK